MRAAFVALAVLLLVPLVAAQLPAAQGYVNDFAGVLSNEPQLESALAAFEKETSVEIAVVTVARIPEGYDTNRYAVELFEQWGVGQQGKDNGLLVVLSVEDRHWRIEVGYGLEPAITDAEAGRIGRAFLEPALEGGNYTEGVTGAVQALAEEVLRERSEETTQGPLGVDWMLWLLVGGVVAVGMVVAVLTGNGWVVWAIVRIVIWLISGGRGGFGGGKSGGGGAGG